MSEAVISAVPRAIMMKIMICSMGNDTESGSLLRREQPAPYNKIDKQQGNDGGRERDCFSFHFGFYNPSAEIRL